MQVVERWILAHLRHQRFATVHEVNQAIKQLLERLNTLPFQKLPPQPRQLRPARPAGVTAAAGTALRTRAFQEGDGPLDYHVEVERHRYSVPHALVGQALEARVTRTMVELLHRGQRGANHARGERQGRFTTWPHTCRRRTVPIWSGRRNA